MNLTAPNHLSNSSAQPQTSTNQPPFSFNNLPLPTSQDGLETISAKLSTYITITRNSLSLADATARRALPIPALSRIKIEMHPTELMFYEAWKEDRIHSLPDIDWVKDRGERPTGQRPLKKAIRRAEALNRIYETDLAEPEHSVWFVQNDSLFLPLVGAVAREIGAERDVHPARKTGSTAEDVAELQTLGRIVRTVLPIVQVETPGPIRKEVARKVGILEGRRMKLRVEMGHVRRAEKRKIGEDRDERVVRQKC